MAPRKTRFGYAPADPKKIVKCFLQDSRFLIVPPGAFNALGVGATQLYNETMTLMQSAEGGLILAEEFFAFDGRRAFRTDYRMYICRFSSSIVWAGWRKTSARCLIGLGSA
ncbi:MAG: hypothetical protein AB7F91_17395 [Parvularculaceae bacterium]